MPTCEFVHSRRFLAALFDDAQNPIRGLWRESRIVSASDVMHLNVVVSWVGSPFPETGRGLLFHFRCQSQSLVLG